MSFRHVAAALGAPTASGCTSRVMNFASVTVLSCASEVIVGRDVLAVAVRLKQVGGTAFVQKSQRLLGPVLDDLVGPPRALVGALRLQGAGRMGPHPFALASAARTAARANAAAAAGAAGRAVRAPRPCRRWRLDVAIAGAEAARSPP